MTGTTMQIRFLQVAMQDAQLKTYSDQNYNFPKLAGYMFIKFSTVIQHIPPPNVQLYFIQFNYKNGKHKLEWTFSKRGDYRCWQLSFVESLVIVKILNHVSPSYCLYLTKC